MSDTSQGDGWWLASDGKWYAPETHPDYTPPPPPPSTDLPPAPPTEQPPDSPPPLSPPTSPSGGDDGKPPLWKRRWFLITAAALLALIVISVITSNTDEDADPAQGDDSSTADDSADGDGDGVAGSIDEDSEEDPTTSEDAPPTTVAATSTAPPEEGGTRDAPFAYGAAAAVTFDSFGDADGSIWNATIGAPVDITAAVLAENQFNDPPADGILFAGFTVEMTLIDAGKEPLSAGFNMSWEILGGATSAVHDESSSDGCGVTPNEFDDFSEVFVGGTLTGVVCVAIPTEDLTDPATQVAIHHSGDSRTHFAPTGVTGTPRPVPEGFSGAASTSDSDGGTRDAPFAYGAAAAVTFDSFGDADGSIWNATIGAPVDITAAVLAENQFNDPPADGILFAGFTVEMTLTDAGKEPLSPGFNIELEILGGASSAVHDGSSSGGCGVTPNEFDGYSEVFVGGTLTGVVCVAIPTEDLTDPATQVAIHHSGDSRTHFAP